MWQGLGLLFGLSFVVLIGVTLLTPAESPETLKRFYERCRPPGFWGPVRDRADVAAADVPAVGGLLANSGAGHPGVPGIGRGHQCRLCGRWWTTAISLAVACASAAWLVVRVLRNPASPDETGTVREPAALALQR